MTAKNSTRKTVIFESQEFKNVKAFSDFIGFEYQYCLTRLRQGLSPEEAVSAPYRWNTSVQNMVVIEGKIYHSMKYATLDYTGIYDDSGYRIVRRENKDLSITDGLHKRCADLLAGRLIAYKNKKYGYLYVDIRACASKLNTQINRLEMSLWNRTSLLSTRVKYCASCGKPFGCGKSSRVKLCSKECMAETKKNTDHGKHIKRARKRGVEYTAGITAKSVAIRDCMICQICGVRVEQHTGGHQLKGWTVGHILAIAKGGAHTWDNVQCECSACNTSKGLIDDAAYKANKMPFKPEIKKAIVAFMDRSVSSTEDKTDQIIKQFDLWG